MVLTSGPQSPPRWWTVLDGLGVCTYWRHELPELRHWQVESTILVPMTFALADPLQAGSPAWDGSQRPQALRTWEGL